jgi:ABC-type multidrug transport system, ATPase component
VKNLSGGYQQRLGIAQAIVHNPKLVVLDEPTNGLDPNQILEIRDLIREIAQDHAVLLSTHILSEVEAICQNIKMIEHGNLIFSGTLDEFHDSVKSNTCIVKLENAPAEGELGNIPGVIKVKKLDEHSFRLQFEQEGEEVAKRVAEICVNRGWRLSEMQMEKVSMDEIFAQLSGKRVVDKF